MDREIDEISIKKEQIENVSRKLNYTFPSDYIDYYLSISDLHIKPNLFMVNNKEKILRYLFSMDENHKSYIMKFQGSDSKYDEQLITFAELEFGDSLCFDRNTNEIIYYDHELDSITKLADNWTQVRDMLYADSRV